MMYFIKACCDSANIRCQFMAGKLIISNEDTAFLEENNIEKSDGFAYIENIHKSKKFTSAEFKSYYKQISQNLDFQQHRKLNALPDEGNLVTAIVTLSNVALAESNLENVKLDTLGEVAGAISDYINDEIDSDSKFSDNLEKQRDKMKNGMYILSLFFVSFD